MSWNDTYIVLVDITIEDKPLATKCFELHAETDEAAIRCKTILHRLALRAVADTL